MYGNLRTSNRSAFRLFRWAMRFRGRAREESGERRRLVSDFGCLQLFISLFPLLCDRLGQRFLLVSREIFSGSVYLRFASERMVLVRRIRAEMVRTYSVMPHQITFIKTMASAWRRSAVQ